MRRRVSLTQFGAALVSITDGFDTTTAIEWFFFTTIAALVQVERD